MFSKLYELSEKIIFKQDELFTLAINNLVEVNSLEYEQNVLDLKELILEENKLMNLIDAEKLEDSILELKVVLENNFLVDDEDDLNTLDGMEVYMRKLTNETDNFDSLYDVDVLLRVFDRLKVKKYILDGEGINFKLKQYGEYVIDYEVWLWDFITSTLNIEILKSLKNKIYSLVPASDEDLKFIEQLKRDLESLKIRMLFSNFTSEIMAVYALNNLDKMGIVNLDGVMQLKNLEEEDFYYLLVDEAKSYINILAKVHQMKYHPDEIFGFLTRVTSFEVLVSHMNLDSLKEIHNYGLELSSDNNYACMSGINNFVKRKIKRKENY